MRNERTNSSVRANGRWFRWVNVLVFMCGLSAYAVQYVVPGGAGDQSGGSWANAWADVQTAVDAAELQEEEVWVAAGRYELTTPVTLRTNSVVLGGFAGTEIAAEQRDWDANVTILDGMDTTRVVDMIEISGARFDGLIVIRGYYEAPEKGTGGGGVLIQDSKACQVANCKVLHNQSVKAAGSNSCEGGGILLKASSNCVITGCLFTENQATYGTSLSILYGPGTLVNGCRFVGEWQSSAQGVVRVNGNGPFYQNCVFSGNYVQLGSFIYSAQAQTAVNCTVCFTRNATDKAAIHVYSPLVIRNNILAYNHPEAIREMNASADPILENNLFYAQTTADYFDHDGSLHLTGAEAINTNTLPDKASGNVDGNPRFVRCPAQDDGMWTSVGEYEANRAQTTLIDANAAFVPGSLKGLFLNPNTAETLYRHAEIADNTATSITVWGKTAWAAAGRGYRIYDYHLRRDSAAVDTGLTASAPVTDIDGFPRRPNINGIDIGAYELQRKQGTIMMLSAALPEPVWHVRMTSETSGNVVTVWNATLTLTVTEAVAWTIRTLHAGETLMVGSFGANGAVANVKPAVRPPDATDGWIGTGHGFETVSSYTVALDGKNVTLQQGENYPARTVTLTKESTIGPLDQIATMTFPESGDRFVENTRFTANQSLTETLNFVYAYMHCNQNALTDWRAWLTETNVLDGACTQDDAEFHLKKDVRAVALFGPSLNRGLLYYYPEIYQGSGIYNAFWDRANDNKLYFRPNIPGVITLQGDTVMYDLTVIPFQAVADEWHAKAEELMSSLLNNE